MHTNGASHYATLETRIAELELALRVLTRRWEDTLTPRLVAIEGELDRITAELDALTEQ